MTTELTRHRHARRRQQRGAAVFIVVMVLTLLTAVGIFAARSASLVDMASGHSRQALQTQYVTEYGAILAATELGSGTAGEYIREGDKSIDECRANKGLDSLLARKPFCYKLFMPELGERVSTVLGKSVNLLEKDSVAGNSSLGPYAATEEGALQGNFVIELTDPGPSAVPLAGQDVGGVNQAVTAKQFTLTVIGQVIPGGNLNTCDSELASVTGQQMLRAHVVASPIF